MLTEFLYIHRNLLFIGEINLATTNKIGEVTLKADLDIKKGEMVNLRNLFDIEKGKSFVLMTDIALGNDIRIIVDKWGEIDSKADPPTMNVKAGEEINLWRITNFNDFRKEISIAEDIQKDDTLKITIYKI